MATYLAIRMISGVKAVQEFFEYLLLCPLAIHVFGMEADIVDPVVERWRGGGSQIDIMIASPSLCDLTPATYPFKSATVTTPSPFLSNFRNAAWIRSLRDFPRGGYK